MKASFIYSTALLLCTPLLAAEQSSAVTQSVTIEEESIVLKKDALIRALNETGEKSATKIEIMNGRILGSYSQTPSFLTIKKSGSDIKVYGKDKNLIVSFSQNDSPVNKKTAQYNNIHKKAANHAYLSFVSTNKKWGDIIKLFRPLAEQGFFYTTIKYKDQSFTISESSTEIRYRVAGEKRAEKPASDRYISHCEVGFLYIIFPENPEDQKFLTELWKIDTGTYHVIINPPANMNIEQVFQVMNRLYRHIKIGTILVARTLTEEEIDYQNRFAIPELNKTISEFPTPCFRSSSDSCDSCHR